MSDPVVSFIREDSRLISYWKFQQGSGWQKDYGPGRNNLFPINNPIAIRGLGTNNFDRKFINAIQLNSGSQQYFTTPGTATDFSGLNFNRTAQMTIGGWFNFNGQFPNQSEFLLARDDVGSNRSWEAQIIRQSATSGVMGWMSMFDGTATTRQVMYGTNNLYGATYSGQWVHLTWVMDAIGGSGGIYLNAEREPTLRSTNQTGQSGMFEMAGGITSSVFSGVFGCNLGLNIGKSQSAANGNQLRAHCAIQDLFICSGVLSQAEIKSIYHNGIPISGQSVILKSPIISSGEKQLCGWWRLEENSGPRLDSSASGNHLSASGTTASVNSSGVVNLGFRQIASSPVTQHLALHRPGSSGLLYNGSFSVGTWARKEVPSAGGHIIGVDADAGNRTYHINFLSTTGVRYLFMDSSNTTTTINYVPTAYRSSGIFYHTVLVYNNSNNTITAYFDGKQVDQSGSINAPKTNHIAYFSIGNRASSGTANNTLDGICDEAFFIRRALSADEVASIYDFGLDITSFPPTQESGHIGGYLKVYDYFPESGQIGGYLVGQVPSILESGQIAGYTFGIYARESGQIHGFTQAASTSGSKIFVSWIPVIQRTSGTFDWGFTLYGQFEEDFNSIFRVMKTENIDFGAKLQVVNSPKCPSANIWFLNPSGFKGNTTVYASGSGTAYGGRRINRYEWFIPGIGNSGSQNVSFNFGSSSGLYPITLKVYDSDGLIGMTAKFINSASGAENKLPMIQISGYPHDGETPLTVNFSGTFTPAVGDSISSKLWRYGNDRTSILDSPSTLYNAPGCFVPVVTATSALGYTASDFISSGINSLVIS